MTEDTETEQEDVYIVNKLSSATQDDMNRTSPLPAQAPKVNLNTLFADGLEDIRNGLDAQYSTINSLCWLMVGRSDALCLIVEDPTG